ncbi:hypothetical protein B0H65DRAFT_275668 [Neurospora tetraspora]|uniref:Uncharacterized protein n=1 Tax=Neurospora tetraspora TaxID=94610 RepID=A0AAE0JBF4_9PEZI|nr:hypothetical protein B0H65DRAFT_275668 [Neurospora tetraspora]
MVEWLRSAIFALLDLPIHRARGSYKSPGPRPKRGESAPRKGERSSQSGDMCTYHQLCVCNSGVTRQERNRRF